MHYLDGTLVFSPSDLIIFMASPFASWMERLTLENPDHGIESDCRDPLLQILANRGMQHERAYLDQLNAQGLDMVVINDSDPQSAETAISRQRALYDQPSWRYRWTGAKMCFTLFVRNLCFDFLIGEGLTPCQLIPQNTNRPCSIVCWILLRSV
jgi:hypothetical protein